MADHLPNEGPAYGSEDEGSAPGQSRMAGSDDEGEDLMDNLEADYRENELLDNYEADGIDEDYQDEDPVAALAARRAAEQSLDKRDAREGKRSRRLPGALEESSDEEGGDHRSRRQRKRRRAEDGQPEEPDGPLQVDLEAYDGPFAEFLAQEPVQREVARRFRRFLLTFTVNDELVYDGKISAMGQNNKQSLELDFRHLSESIPVLAIFAADVPKVMLDIFNKVATEVTLEKFPEFNQMYDQVFVRISNLPIIDNIRDFRQYHLGLLVRTSGVVTRRTGVYPQLQTVNFDCVKCGYMLGPFTQSGESEVKPNICPQCQSAGPFTMNIQQTVYRNYQRITLQESPGTVPAGRLPRQKDVILVNDLIDIARPGEEIDVVGKPEIAALLAASHYLGKDAGIYTSSFDYGLNVKSGFPVFGTLLEANYIAKRGDAYAAAKLTDEDAEECRRLGQDPRITQRIIKSIAPSIYGLDNVKLGVALALFGGCEKHPSPTTRLRGDINMLILGDPGTAKSQLLKYVERVAQRAVYTTGKGASAVGLTAAVQKDPITREWTLEGGALVLADKGVCLIDEFDKMNEQDRVSIHEAMEQQTISISKAGIVTTLQARCCVLAAANPIGGRYDASRTFAENVELSDPILSRFDILAVVRDVVDPVNDERLASFVVDSHMRSNQGMDEGAEEDEEAVNARKAKEAAAKDPDIIPQELLRKYITYAKVRCTPKLRNTDYDKIAQVYAELRREAAVTHSMPIAVRHLESIIRMAEAHARMHLREYISNDDIDTAIRVLLESFVASQKYSVQKALTRRFRRFLTFKQDFNILTLNMLRELVRKAQRTENMGGRVANEDYISVEVKSLAEKMREYNINDLEPFYSSQLFSDVGFKLSEDQRTILLSRGIAAE